MHNYVVCMDSAWIRDTEMFNTVGLTDDELANIDIHSVDNIENEERWHDMEPTPFIAIIKAENENEACQTAAVKMRYDPRCLFAIKVL